MDNIELEVSPELKDVVGSIESHLVNTESTATSKKVSISGAGYRKGDPQKNPDTNYVFTENAEADSAANGISDYTEQFPYKGKVKLNVSDVGGTNQAGIRTDSKGNLSDNAFGLVVKKYQHNKEGRFIHQEGCFKDTEEDFSMFTSLNLKMFQKLEESAFSVNT